MDELQFRLLDDKSGTVSALAGGAGFRAGDRVRLRPRKGGDVFDIVLAGRSATVEAVEQDFENKIHLAVTIDDDPGNDLGMMRQAGHRFFFSPDEVEPIVAGSPELFDAVRSGVVGKKARTEAFESNVSVQRSNGGNSHSILVACIGNIFLGDDGFGCAVAREMQRRKLPDNVRLVDFGIRGYDLAYSLLDECDLTILVDAAPRGGAKGTVYVIEPDLSDFETADAGMLDAHTMNPMHVLRLAISMGAKFRKLLLVGCEPATFGGEEGLMGLSEPVQKAVGEAADVIDQLIEHENNGRKHSWKMSEKEGMQQMERSEQMQKREGKSGLQHRGNGNDSGASTWLYIGGGAALILAAAVVAINLPDLKRYIKMSRM